MDDNKGRTNDDELVLRQKHDLERRPDALARRVLDDLSASRRRVLLLCPKRDLRRGVREALESVSSLSIVEPRGRLTDEAGEVDLVLDVEDGRGVRLRRERQMGTPLMCVRRTVRGEPRVPGLNSMFCSDKSELAQCTSFHFGQGKAPEEERCLRENVAIGVELAHALDKSRELRSRRGQATVLWVSRRPGHAEERQRLFGRGSYSIRGARPEETADAVREAGDALDVLVCPIEDAGEALADIADLVRTRVPWVGEGGDPPSDPPPEVVACMRGSLPWNWLRLDQPIDEPTGQLRGVTFLNPLAGNVLGRALWVRQAMECAALAGRLSTPRLDSG